MALIKFSQREVPEAGCDEAGRGCLAGPVVAAAVILDPRKSIRGLDDSKKLTARERELLRDEIEEKALAWAVASLSPADIDRHNILRASFLAMHQALDQLELVPGLLLIDGNRFIKYRDVPHRCEVKGDGRYQSIAAASILAKTHRDATMLELAERYPQYGWKTNKGYPTEDHRDAIRRFGPCEHHRKSFRLLEDQLKLL